MWSMSDTNTDVVADSPRFGSVRYDCRSTERLELDTSTAIVQWSSDVHPAFKASYFIG
jgi:hypothetical protein